MLLLGSDHGGYELKEQLKAHLTDKGIAFEDLGCFAGQRVDYPDVALAVARRVAGEKNTRGVLLCGTGIGMSLAANKVDGVRAALVHDHYTARMASAHNNANILCLGGRVLGLEVARECLDAWLSTPYEGGRHELRLVKIAAAE